MTDFKQQFLKAQRELYEAKMRWHIVNVNNLLENPAAVAEHPDHMATIESELGVIAEYADKLEVLDKYF
jgi:hypothetical protein